MGRAAQSSGKQKWTWGRHTGHLLQIAVAPVLSQVKIMMSHDPEGKMGPKMQLPDNVIVHEPKAAGPRKPCSEPGVSMIEPLLLQITPPK